MRGRILCCAIMTDPFHAINFPGFFIGFMLGVFQSMIILTTITDFSTILMYGLIEMIFYGVYDHLRQTGQF